MPREPSGERFQLGEFWLSRRPNSDQWCRTWFDARARQTRRASLGTSDHQLARVRLAEWYVENAQLKDESPAEVPVATILRRYYSEHGSLIASRATQKRACDLWMEFFGDATVAELSIARQEAFVAWLRARALADGYVRRVLGVGKAALNRAYQRQELASAPYIKLDLADPGEAFEHTAELEQLAAFLNAVPEHLDHVFAYVMVRLTTLCRGDAARDLTRFQVHDAAGFVKLNPPGRKQTKKRRPDVPLTDTLRAFLRSQEPESYVVHWHGRRVKSVRRAWALVAKAAGLPAWFVPKILRHTGATELRRRGVPGWEVSAILGHTRTEAAPTTANYAKYDPTYLSHARTAIDAWMRELAAKVPRLRAICVLPGDQRTA